MTEDQKFLIRFLIGCAIVAVYLIAFGLVWQKGGIKADEPIDDMERFYTFSTIKGTAIACPYCNADISEIDKGGNWTGKAKDFRIMAEEPWDCPSCGVLLDKVCFRELIVNGYSFYNRNVRFEVGKGGGAFTFDLRK